MKARTLKSALPIAAIIALMALPETAMAAGGLGAVTSFLKDIAQAIFIDWGYYIGIILGAFVVWRFMSGHMELASAGKYALAIVIFFILPSLVSGLRDQAAGVL